MRYDNWGYPVAGTSEETYRAPLDKLGVRWSIAKLLGCAAAFVFGLLGVLFIIAILVLA